MNSHDSRTTNGGGPLPFVIDYVPDFVLKQAQTELNETMENKTRCLQEMKEMLKRNETTGDTEFFDDFLLQFLRHRKYNVPKAFGMLLNYLSLRKKHPHLFEDMPSEVFSEMSSSRVFTLLPLRSPDGCAIGYGQGSNFDPHKPISDVWRVVMVSFSQSLRDPMTQVCGYKIIYDFENVSIKNLWHCTPKNVWFFYSISVNCLPARYKEIHVVNQSVVFKTLWTMMKGLLSEKITKRIHFHSSPDKLLDYFPRSVLPTKYGGDLKDYFMSEWLQNANKQLGESTERGQPNLF